mmetsp:Transcript_12769/g.31349  ORF Transcript_12769/g.31349 Transcript_12769/m.31349 type:complete len:345 (-) Transcript_12769:897-1931(-)
MSSMSAYISSSLFFHLLPLAGVAPPAAPPEGFSPVLGVLFLALASGVMTWMGEAAGAGSPPAFPSMPFAGSDALPLAALSAAAAAAPPAFAHPGVFLPEALAGSAAGVLAAPFPCAAAAFPGVCSWGGHDLARLSSSSKTPPAWAAGVAEGLAQAASAPLVAGCAPLVLPLACAPASPSSTSPSIAFLSPWSGSLRPALTCIACTTPLALPHPLTKGDWLPACPLAPSCADPCTERSARLLLAEPDILAITTYLRRSCETMPCAAWMMSSVLCASPSRRGHAHTLRSKLESSVNRKVTRMMGGSTSLNVRPVNGIVPIALKIDSNTVASATSALLSCASCSMLR